MTETDEQSPEPDEQSPEPDPEAPVAGPRWAHTILGRLSVAVTNMVAQRNIKSRVAGWMRRDAAELRERVETQIGP